MYKENPKTKGSGIICAIPQSGICPNKCEDCFFQSGRSYLEPLEENLPNMPLVRDSIHRIVLVNDGNDSNVNQNIVIETTKKYKMKFYNTAIPKDLEEFDAPVVLTINPSRMTDKEFYKLDPIPKNLMFVRFRVNMWNLVLCAEAVNYYSSKEIPIVLTFMAYYNQTIPKQHENCYVFKKRTLNSYWVLKTEKWEEIMSIFKRNKWVYSCSKREGEEAIRECHRCGNCLREYFYTMEKLRGFR